MKGEEKGSYDWCSAFRAREKRNEGEKATPRTNDAVISHGYSRPGCSRMRERGGEKEKRGERKKRSYSNFPIIFPKCLQGCDYFSPTTTTITNTSPFLIFFFSSIRISRFFDARRTTTNKATVF